MPEPRICASILTTFPWCNYNPLKRVEAIRAARFEGLQMTALRRASINTLREMARVLPFLYYEEPWKYVGSFSQAIFGSVQRHHKKPTLLDFFLFGYGREAREQIGFIRALKKNCVKSRLIGHSEQTTPLAHDALYEIAPVSWRPVSEIIERTPEREYAIDTGHISRLRLAPDELTARPHCYADHKYSVLGDYHWTVPMLLETGRVKVIHVKAMDHIADWILDEVRKRHSSVEAIVFESVVGKSGLYWPNVVRHLEHGYRWIFDRVYHEKS